VSGCASDNGVCSTLEFTMVNVAASTHVTTRRWLHMAKMHSSVGKAWRGQGKLNRATETVAPRTLTHPSTGQLTAFALDVLD
jgi:hypothetical protein